MQTALQTVSAMYNDSGGNDTHAFFDLDGTLTESGPGIIHSFRYALAQLGMDPDGFDLSRVIGPPLSYSFRSFGIAEDRIPEAVRLYRHLYNDTGKYENLPYAGIEEMLAALKAAGVKLYVATSKPEGLAKDILAHFRLDHYFEIIAGAAPDGTRSSKQAVLEYLMEQIITPPDAVMIGDTVFDIEGAAAVDLPAIGVCWGYGNTEETKKAGAAAIAHTPAELTDFILG